jgi:hypothetical protein
MPVTATGATAHILRGGRDFIFPNLLICLLVGKRLLFRAFILISQAKFLNETHSFSPFC